MTDLDDQEYLIRGALASELGDLAPDWSAEELVQNTVALTQVVMEALHGPPPWSRRQESDGKAPCEWCGRAIHSPMGSRYWLAVKGVERGYDPMACEASNDGKHNPAASGS
jgi:hypothetical protein